MTFNQTILTVASLALMAGPVRTVAVDNTEVRSADQHTIALWLFDDTSYPSAILTDTGPYRHDLRLLCGYAKWWVRTGGKSNPDEEPLHRKGSAGLVKGKFGNAQKLPAGGFGEVKWPDLSRYDTGSGQPDRNISNPEVQKSYFYIATGLIAANIYLFAASQGLAAWFHNCNREAAAKEFKLRPEQRVLFAQTVGYPT